MIHVNVKNLAFVAAVPLMFCSLASGQTLDAGAQAATNSPAGGSRGVQIFGGLRVWGTTWDLPIFSRAVEVNPATGMVAGTRDVVQRSTDTKAAPVPFLGVRYGNFTASASHWVKTSYDFEELPSDVNRKELDVTVGYYILPQIAVSAGYKNAKVDRLSPLAEGGSKTEAFLIGASGSVPLEGTGRLSLYGNFAFGPGKSTSYVGGNNNKVDVTYRIGEIGLSYQLLSAPQGALKHLGLSLGYRAQIVTFKDVPLSTYTLSNPTIPVSVVERKDIQTNTDGVVIGLTGVF